MHNLLKEHVPEEVVRVEATKVYDYLRNSAQEEAMFYLRFFTGSLSLLDVDQQNAVFEYVFSILENDPIERLRLFSDWDCFGWLGSYLDDDSGVQRLWWCILHHFLRPADGAYDFLSTVVQVCQGLSGEHKEWLVGRLREWSAVKELQEWADYIDEGGIDILGANRVLIHKAGQEQVGCAAARIHHHLPRMSICHGPAALQRERGRFLYRDQCRNTRRAQG